MQILLWTATLEDCPIPSFLGGGGRGVAVVFPKAQFWTLCEVKFVEILISQQDEQMQQKQMDKTRGL